MFSDVTEERLKKKISRGRQRHKTLDDLTGSGSYEQMNRKAENRTLAVIRQNTKAEALGYTLYISDAVLL